MFGQVSLVLLLLCFLTMTACSSSSEPKTNQMEKAENPIAVIHTNRGDVTVRLLRDKAPITVNNFLVYAKEGFYDGTIFHRVIEDFMIQGGGFTSGMRHKPTHEAIKNEANNGVANKRGTVAMARTADVNSATAQFFINVVDNAFLDHRGDSRNEYGYAVFGEVIDGMDVVDAIRRVQTQSQGAHQNVPVEAIVIKSVEVK